MAEELADSSLDLTHLTEAEQSAVLQVLQRDLDLRLLDEGRVRLLQQTETDPVRLRSMSGAWFTEERNKRHRLWSSSALVHATLRCSRTKSKVTDVALIGLFDAEKEKTSHSNCSSPASERRLKDTKDVESQGSRLCLKPSPKHREKSLIAKYQVRMGDLQSRTLNLSVWHAETMWRNVFLGEVEVSLGLWDWTYTQPVWHDLQPRVTLNPKSISSRGTIVLSIKFIPDGFEGGGVPLTGELYIWLREAQGLMSYKGGPVDSFVRSYILPDASWESGQKTRTIKRSISPTYNHTMVYDGFHTSDLKEACAELTVWQRERLKTRMLGGVRLSCGTGQSYGEAVSWMDSTEEEVAVWTSMIKNPNHWIDTTLPIRTNLARR